MFLAILIFYSGFRWLYCQYKVVGDVLVADGHVGDVLLVVQQLVGVHSGF